MALGQIEKQFGKGANNETWRLHSNECGSNSTGALSLDIALGIGGIQEEEL